MTGVDSFLQHLKQAKRYSVHTIRAYQNDLNQFSAYLKDTYQVNNIHDSTAIMIRSWLVELISMDTSRTTINRKRSALKSYFRHCIRGGVIDFNPMDKIVALKKDKKLPVFVEEKHMNSLLDEPGSDNEFSKCRDHLVLLLLYTTGMRQAELIGLRTSDADIYNSTIKITGKGNKQRILPLLPEVTALLPVYLRLRDKEFGSANNQSLLVTNKGKEMYPKFVYSLVNFYLSKVTTIGKKSPHVLRHSFATHMLNNGADLNAIKQMLGHANLSATQVYTHNSITKIRSVYKQAHPKA